MPCCARSHATTSAHRRLAQRQPGLGAGVTRSQAAGTIRETASEPHEPGIAGQCLLRLHASRSLRSLVPNLRRDNQDDIRIASSRNAPERVEHCLTRMLPAPRQFVNQLHGSPQGNRTWNATREFAAARRSLSTQIRRQTPKYTSQECAGTPEAPCAITLGHSFLRPPPSGGGR